MVSHKEMLPRLAGEAVAAFGFDRGPVPNCLGSIAAIGCWWIGKDRANPPWKLVLEPRCLAVMSPTWYVEICTDSSDAAWIVTTRGELSDHEPQFRQLIDSEDTAWHSIRSAWAADLRKRREALLTTRKAWPEQRSGTTRMRLAPSQLEVPSSTSSVEDSTSTTPQFGDLRFMPKYSSRKAPHRRRR